MFKMADEIMTAARKLCKKDAKTERDFFGELLPCRKISPLEPFIKLEEYFMLERDMGKYLLYMAAIQRAISDIISSKPSDNELTMKCFVLGPGLGRLVRYCLDSASQLGFPACIHVMEANPVAVEFLMQSFEKEINDKVVILYEPFTFHPDLTISDLPLDLQKHCGTFDLIVSELLGCFGDDEFLPELTATLYKVLARPESGVMIPENWTNYLVPVSCLSTYTFLRTHNKSLNAGYTMGLPQDCVFLSDTKSAWTGDCKKVENIYNCQLEFSLDPKLWVTACSLEDGKYFGENSCEVKLDKSCNVNLCCHGDNSDLVTKNMGCHGDDINMVTKNTSCHGDDANLVTKDMSCHGDDSKLVTKDMSCHGDKSNMATVSKQHNSYDSTTKVNETSQIDCNFDKQEFIGDESRHGNYVGQTLIMSETDSHFHGFIGYFTSTLYKDIMIDTRHTANNRNSFHWECYFVPVLQPIAVGRHSKITLNMARKTSKDNIAKATTLKLWYEWQIVLENGFSHHQNALQERVHPPAKKAIHNKTETLIDIKSMPNYCNTNIGFENPSDTLPHCSIEYNEESKYCSISCEKENSVYEFPLQNRDGNNDAVFLSWAIEDPV